MIVFNHFFDFESEPFLQEDDDGKHTVVTVCESAGSALPDRFSFASPLHSLSGRETRYHSERDFSEMKAPFSWALDIAEVAALVWDCEHRRIEYIKYEKYTPELLRFWVFHTFFPIVLELERIYRILHVGSVEIEGRPVLFSAFSFGGKSTLTDYFIRRGHTLLSDDTLGIDKRGDNYYAIPSYPFHRPYREAEALGYPAPRFAIEPKPLHAVYLLEKSDSDARVAISEVRGIEKFKAFRYAIYVDFDFMKQERFDYFGEMSKYIPVYRVHIPWDLERLGDVYEAIVVHNRALCIPI